MIKLRFCTFLFALASAGLASAQNAAPPASTNAVKEEAVVLTPKPGPKPRINGARVFGIRPGSPFLFTIAVTGDRPMTFSAKHLPAGFPFKRRQSGDQSAGRNQGRSGARDAPHGDRDDRAPQSLQS